MSNPKIVQFENMLSDLITELFTEDDIKDLEYYFEDSTIMSSIKEALGLTSDE